MHKLMKFQRRNLGPKDAARQECALSLRHRLGFAEGVTNGQLKEEYVM